MSSPTAGPEGYQGPQPTPEEMRAYLEQLRESDPAGVVVQAFQMLATGAQVKLGRSDARLLIDAMAALVASVGERLGQPQLTDQLKAVVAELQSAQVQAEAELRQHAATSPSEAAAAGEPAAGPTGGQGQPGEPEQGGQRMTDRLWIPGRGATPPRT